MARHAVQALEASLFLLVVCLAGLFVFGDSLKAVAAAVAIGAGVAALVTLIAAEALGDQVRRPG